MRKAQKTHSDNYNRTIVLTKDKTPVLIPKKTFAVRINSYTFGNRLGVMLLASNWIGWLCISIYLELSSAEGFEILNSFSNLASGFTIGSSILKSSSGSSIWSSTFSPFPVRLLAFSSKWRLEGQCFLMKQGNILTYCHFPLSAFIQAAVCILNIILRILLSPSR